MADRYDLAGRYGVMCAHISQAAVLPQSLGNCMRKGQHLQEENNSEVREKPATALCRGGYFWLPYRE
jgi:hypothetical protein